MRELFGYALYLVLAALALIGALVLYNSLEKSSNIEVTRVEIITFKVEMNKNFARRPGRYGENPYNHSNLVTLGIAPTSTRFSDTSLKNAWSGDIAVIGNGASFFLDYDAIPKDVCTNLLTQFNNDLGILSVRAAPSIGGLAGAPEITPLPANDTQAITACASPTNAIRWQMR